MISAQRAKTPRIAIIGSGFSGLCLGIQLKKAGIDSFTIYEKAARLGGTWRDNTYPGACCDVPAMSYCFSFEQKTDWSRKWVAHDEILGYKSTSFLAPMRFEGRAGHALDEVWKDGASVPSVWVSRPLVATA